MRMLLQMPNDNIKLKDLMFLVCKPSYWVED